MLWGERRGNYIHRQTDVNREMAPIGAEVERPMEPPMRKPKQHKLNEWAILRRCHQTDAVEGLGVLPEAEANFAINRPRGALCVLTTSGTLVQRALEGSNHLAKNLLHLVE